MGRGKRRAGKKWLQNDVKGKLFERRLDWKAIQQPILPNSFVYAAVEARVPGEREAGKHFVIEVLVRYEIHHCHVAVGLVGGILKHSKDPCRETWSGDENDRVDA